MILNENLFENESTDTNQLSIEDKFNYLKNYPIYYSDHRKYYTRPCKVYDLGLTDEQQDVFFKALSDESDLLPMFWDANEELSQDIYQAGRMGGHLILDTKVVDPDLYTHLDSFNEVVQEVLNQDYYPDGDDGEYTQEQINNATQDTVEEIDKAYNDLKDFDNRVNQLIELLKQTLDGYVDPGDDLEESVEGDKMAQDIIDSKNANFELDKQNERDSKLELAKQGIITESDEDEPFKFRIYEYQENGNRVDLEDPDMSYSNLHHYIEETRRGLGLDEDLNKNNIKKDAGNVEITKNGIVAEGIANHYTIEINDEIYCDDFGEPYHFNNLDEAEKFIEEHELKNTKITAQYGLSESTPISEDCLKKDAGNVEQGVKMFNQTVNANNSEASVTEELSDESIKETDDLENKVVEINIRKELDNFDRDHYRDLVNLYNSVKLTLDDKESIARLILDNKPEEIEKLLNKIFNDQNKIYFDDIDEGFTADDFIRDTDADLRDISLDMEIAGPASRGKDHPAYNKLEINESEFPDNMRFKDWGLDVIGEDLITMDYITQEPFTSKEAEPFIYEVKRAFTELAKSKNYTKPFTVALDVRARDGREYGELITNININ